MTSISLCMIVRNEEDVLSRCLESIADLMDEIILVDTGSTDTTKEIALKYTDKIYDFTWIDDFSAARNYAFSLANSEYCMWLDADDIIKEEDRKKLCLLKGSLTPNISVVMMPYHTGFDKSEKVTFSYYRERIIKNNQTMKWEGAVHEVITPIGEIRYEQAAVSHKKLHPSDADRNIRIFESQIEKGILLDAREQFYYARELYYHKEYEKAINILEHFLAEDIGWVENKIDACSHKAYCYYALGKDKKALESLLYSLTYDLPRAEICCDIGKHFLEREDLKKAAFWYTIATTCKKEEKRGGFVANDCYDYLPCIQLCVCYSRMGEVAKAIKFNELAGAFKPESEAVEYNRVFFENLKKNSLLV